MFDSRFTENVTPIEEILKQKVDDLNTNKLETFSGQIDKALNAFLNEIRFHVALFQKLLEKKNFKNLNSIQIPGSQRKNENVIFQYFENQLPRASTLGFTYKLVTGDGENILNSKLIYDSNEAIQGKNMTKIVETFYENVLYIRQIVKTSYEGRLDMEKLEEIQTGFPKFGVQQRSKWWPPKNKSNGRYRR